MKKTTPLSRFRETRGLTIDAVAELFDVNRTTIIRWEKGSPPIPVKRLAQAEQITGIPRYELRPDVFGTAHPPSPQLAGSRMPSREPETTGGAA